jgi:hypothetical protein
VDEWKKLICRGNRSYENGRLEDARLLYRAALDQAERSLALCGDRGGLCTYADALAAVAAVVVTEHNLADLCLRCDQVEDAGAHTPRPTNGSPHHGRPHAALDASRRRHAQLRPGAARDAKLCK